MAMDYIDMLVDTSSEKLTGYFYKRRPRTPEDGRITFKYEQLDPNSRVFDKVLGNVRADRATYAIKTNDHCGFNVGGYIITQNGLIWEITEVVTNEQAKGSNDVLRWFRTAKNAECNVRMIQVDDLFVQEESYVDECKVTVALSYPLSEIETATINDVTNNEEGIAYTKADNKITFYVPKGAYVSGEISYRKIFQPLKVAFKISGYQTQGNEYSTTIKV